MGLKNEVKTSSLLPKEKNPMNSEKKSKESSLTSSSAFNRPSELKAREGKKKG